MENLTMMKIIRIIFSLVIILLLSCRKDIRTDPSTRKQSAGEALPVTSINSIKDGKPFINYLGIKMEGC
jgi:hypothetical protein